MVKSPEYIIHKYCELNMDQGKVRKRFNVRASAAGTIQLLIHTNVQIIWVLRIILRKIKQRQRFIGSWWNKFFLLLWKKITR